MKNTTWKMSEADSDLLMETLEADTRSKAFDRELRVKIAEALNKVEITGPPARCTMTPEEFIEKYPKASMNGNCLQDIACPHCGNREQFKVEIHTVGSLCDNGTDAEVGGHEYDDSHYIECCECARHSTVAGFTIEGLDDLIEERIP